MGDNSLDATSWPDAGHRLGRLVRDVLEAGHAFLVVSAPATASTLTRPQAEGWLGEPIEPTAEKDERRVERVRRAVFGGTNAEPLRHLGEPQTYVVIL